MRYIYPARLKSQRTHPLIFVAAVSITFFSLAGAAAMLGYQPLAQAGSTLSNNCTASAQAMDKQFDDALRSDSNTYHSNVAGSREASDIDGFNLEMPSVDADNAQKDFRVFITKA